MNFKEGKLMLRLNKNSKQYIVEGASHNVHLENPKSYIDILDNLNCI